MNFFDVLTMFGGLALFLYGMHLMGEGLEKASGGKLEKILEKLTSNPIKAVFLGAGVTAVIQSSSATTVMVVGFVNSGIMKLSQAIGIIMGANIGTTVTSWILSLSGIESSNFYIKLLKPSSFSPALAMIGVVFLLFSKKEKKKNIGSVLLGFAILMFGMETMSDAVKPLADVPEFTSLLTMFSNPLLGMLAGAILTAIIQSSSASVGILQALCITGSISYATALPIIMGQNIGTCITAMISSIGASKNAKRAALVHLYFNLIGTSVFMIVFYTVNVFVKFAFLSESANAMGIAEIHSLFNIGATLLLLPCTKGLEKLAYLTLPEHKQEAIEQNQNDFKLLDERFLEKPAFAVEQCRNVAVHMSELAKEGLFKAIGLLEHYEQQVADEVRLLEDKVDKYEDELGTYLIKLSSKHLSEKDSRTLSIILHCIGDFERISDHSMNIMESAKEIYDKKIQFSQEAMQEVEVFTKALKEIVTISMEAFKKEDIGLSITVEPLEEVIDYLNDNIKKRHVERLTTGKCTIELGFTLSDLLNNFERVSDHCSNIAVCLIQAKEKNFDIHEYINKVKGDNNQEFQTQYAKYIERYMLP